MEGVEDLYFDLILDHYKNPRRKGKVDPADIAVAGVNPLCGDELELTLRIAGNRIEKLAILPKGCAISQSSASLMGEVLEGRTLDEAKEIVDHFKEAVLGKNSTLLPEELSKLEALRGVKNYPARVKCATLAWNAFLDGFREYLQKKSPVTLRHDESAES